MDKIWNRKSFEVGGHWLLWRGWKTEGPRRTDKSWTLKKIIVIYILCFGWLMKNRNSLVSPGHIITTSQLKNNIDGALLLPCNYSHNVICLPRSPCSLSYSILHERSLCHLYHRGSSNHIVGLNRQQS